jgi:AcrR family transcriptional regulator
MSTDAAPYDGRVARWSGQQQRRRAEFVEAALVAIAEHGPGVSTEQIAAQAGVARTRLYKHFAGASELNQAIATRAVEMVLAALEPVWNPQGTPATMIESALRTHLGWLAEHQHLYRYLTKHSMSDEPTTRDAVTDVKWLIAEHLRELFGTFAEPFGLPREMSQPLAFGLVGFVDAAANRWVEDPSATSLEEMVTVLGRWIWVILDDTLRSVGMELDPQQPLVAPQG